MRRAAAALAVASATSAGCARPVPNAVPPRVSDGITCNANAGIPSGLGAVVVDVHEERDGASPGDLTQLPGARVSVGSRSAEADHRGWAVLFVPPGPTIVRVELPGFDSARVEVMVRGGCQTVLTVKLPLFSVDACDGPDPCV